MRFPLYLLISRSAAGTDITVFATSTDAYTARAAAARADWAQLAGRPLTGPGRPTDATVPDTPPADDERAGNFDWATRHDQGANESSYVEEHHLDLAALDPAALACWQNAIATEIAHRTPPLTNDAVTDCASTPTGTSPSATTPTLGEVFDPREVGVMFSWPVHGAGRAMPVRDAAGRIRVFESDGRRVGWADIGAVEWTDSLP
ncbi:hypothetical protein [Catenuloplanes japonicus]|uniref:hypothetical protein n=1 Tax=Catenuloplanes japonicus TaxID=33876 RepID=UPI00068BEEDC|nr:hypothetical protein [Catenuloplanes japonicus]